MNDIFEQIQNDFNEFMKQAKELVEKERVADARQTKRWKPKDGDRVWLVFNNGELEETTYLGGMDGDILKLGNCFKTEQEAQKELDRRLAEHELLDLCDGSLNDCEWYSIYYNKCEKIFKATHILTISLYVPYCFASRESCKRAIDTLGQDKLKLIFRID